MGLRSVDNLLNNWKQLRDVKGDCTRLYAIAELEAALAAPEPAREVVAEDQKGACATIAAL